MKRFFVFAFSIALLAACSTKEIDFQTPIQDDIVFYASFEQPSEDGTRVYATEDLFLRWNADDRVSIFNKNTYNQQYQFTGKTGANSGGFKKVETDEFMTGNSIADVVSVYPYQEATEITENETLTLTLPAEQMYAENTFGLGANTMVSVTSDNFLQYKNVGGYLMLKLYGEGVAVSSITLKGNNGEKLAGKSTVTMPLNGVPSVTMPDDAMTEITLTCPTPVQLGSTEEDCTEFWFVIPPVTFDQGFTVTVNKTSGATFEKSTSNNVVVYRNKMTKMSAINTETDTTQPNNEIWYTSTDGKTVDPSTADVFGTTLLSNTYENGKGILRFESDVTTIGRLAFYSSYRLETISLPKSVKAIEKEAFIYCYGLTSITIPDSVTSIGIYAFDDCKGLTSIEIPRSVTSFGFPFILGCDNLSTIVVAPDNPVFDSRDDCNAIIRTADNELVCGCNKTVIPNSVTAIGGYAFDMCIGLTSIEIPNSVTTIWPYAFYDCPDLTSIVIPESVTYIGSGIVSSCHNLNTLIIDANNPNYDSRNDCNAVIETKNNKLIVGCNHSFIPNTVTSIGGYAFSRCHGLKSIEIPSSVSVIAYHAFAECSGLTSIRVLSSTPPEGGDNMFVDTYCPIYVPAHSVEAYKEAAYWSDYADRIQAIPSAPLPDAVDLGLSVKWASFNLGASKPEEYGDYYAWGETDPYYSSLDPLTWKEGKEAGYHWESYKWCRGSSGTMTKYCRTSSYGYEGFTDNKTVLDFEDDAAHVSLGGTWRMPTDAEWTELKNNCTWTWTTQNGVIGRLVTASNGNSIFLPAAGYQNETNLNDVGSCGYYRSSSLDTGVPCLARFEYFDFYNAYNTSGNRCYGLSVRPVYSE